jgi:hypothetical protein
VSDQSCCLLFGPRSVSVRHPQARGPLRAHLQHARTGGGCRSIACRICTPISALVVPHRRCYQRSTHSVEAPVSLHCCYCYYCYMVQDSPEHPVGSQQGSWVPDYNGSPGQLGKNFVQDGLFYHTQGAITHPGGGGCQKGTILPASGCYSNSRHTPVGQEQACHHGRGQG